MRLWFLILLTAGAVACNGDPAEPKDGKNDAKAGDEAASDKTPDAPTPAADAPPIKPIDPDSFVVEVKTRDRRNMVKVGGGKFLRGSPDGVGTDAERPQKKVRLETFWIDRAPVTVSQFKRCVEARRCKETTFRVGPEKRKHKTRPQDCNYGVPGREDEPMNCVSWFGARTYCRWAEKKLPTEAQWEKAARGTDGRLYPWGNDAPTCDNACLVAAGGEKCPKGEDAAPFTCKVGSKEAGVSPYGALDMGGNVWEWVEDGWSPTFYKDDPETNSPVNSSRTPKHPVRGGSASSDPESLRSAYRIAFTKEATPAWVGIRCALD